MKWFKQLRDFSKRLEEGIPGKWSLDNLIQAIKNRKKKVGGGV